MISFLRDDTAIADFRCFGSHIVEKHVMDNWPIGASGSAGGGHFDRVVASVDESYEAAQNLFSAAPAPLSDPVKSGSSQSLIDWSAMGQPGRNFVISGPGAEAITRFTGAPALDPIRVYVGRADGLTPQARAELALAELRRVGALCVRCCR
ncbi:MAG: alpha/beta-hydrolase N-terminal domain-containing protein [Alphaproteobacteria bacterium]